MKTLLSILNDIPADTLHFRLVADWRDYQRDADARRSIWNSPSAREEAGRCLMCADPWREFNNSAPEECRAVGFWRDVASWIFSALTEDYSLGGAA